MSNYKILIQNLFDLEQKSKTEFKNLLDKTQNNKPLANDGSNLSQIPNLNNQKTLDNPKTYDFSLLSKDIIYTCATENKFARIVEATPQFWLAYEWSTKYQEILRNNLHKLLESKPEFISEFDSLLIQTSLKVSKYYENYYIEWFKTVYTTPSAEFIKKQLANADNKAFLDQIKQKGLDNAYTIIHPIQSKAQNQNIKNINSVDELTHSAYYTVFKPQIDPIINEFKDFINKAKTLKLENEQTFVIEFFEAYLASLTETNIDKLEDLGKNLDIVWMKNKYPIQIVHDIETDYADPLGVKVIPDFSLRFPDFTSNLNFEDVNLVHNTLIDYYKTANIQKSDKEIFALTNSWATFCYLPVNSGISLYFKFSGQSIPNRKEVRQNQGVKVFLDFITTQNRSLSALELANKVLDDPNKYLQYFSVECEMIFHVVGHEYGHTIHGFKNYESTLDLDLTTSLEETRADLNGTLSTYLLYKQGKKNIEYLKKRLLTEIIFELRRFANWESKAIYPYKLSMLYLYRTLSEFNIISLNKDGKLQIDLQDKLILDFYEQELKQLEQIHIWQEQANNKELRQFLDKNKTFAQSELCKQVLKLVTE